MKSLFTLLFIISFLNAYGNEKEIEISVLYEKVLMTKKNAQLVKKIWVKHMEEQEITKKMRVKFYDNEDLILNRYLSDKNVGILFIHPSLYYKNKEILDKNTIFRWVLVIANKNDYEKYYIVKNKKSKISLDNLDDVNILYSDNISKIWLEYFLMKKYKKNVDNIINKMTNIKNNKKLIYDIFFNNKSLSIIPKRLYDDMIEINPQILKKIDVIAESDSIFITAIGLTKKTLSNKVLEMLKESAEEINNSGKSYRLYRFINIRKVIQIDDNYIKELDKFFKEYFYLKDKYHK